MFKERLTPYNAPIPFIGEKYIFIRNLSDI